MTREIKFRAWDKEEKLYLGWYEGSFVYSETSNKKEELTGKNLSFGYVFSSNNFIIEQYTGLKDKNDREIYEGDILEDGDDLCRYQITFFEGSWWGDCVNASADLQISELTSCFIIGNIYENPELITNLKE